MSWRDMAIDAGAVGEDEIQQMAHFLKSSFMLEMERLAYEAEELKRAYRLLEMRENGLCLTLLPARISHRTS